MSYGVIPPPHVEGPFGSLSQNWTVQQVIVSFMESKPKMMMKVPNYIEQANCDWNSVASFTVVVYSISVSFEIFRCAARHTIVRVLFHPVNPVSSLLRSRYPGPESLHKLHGAAQR